MKRGQDDEKIMGPMFPRLHVNDTDKGGPRAPPRNKMALYEQLSIPSQRFNSGVLPLNPKTTSNMVPSASSSQVIFFAKLYKVLCYSWIPWIYHFNGDNSFFKFVCLFVLLFFFFFFFFYNIIIKKKY